MERHRKSLQHCYLCGCRTRLSQQSDTSDPEINADHLPPRGVLGSAPSSASWRPIVDVHARCHRMKNSRGEDLAIQLHRAFIGQWQSASDRLKHANIEPFREWVLSDDKLSLRAGLANVDFVRSTAIEWGRGLYALLYGRFMPLLTGALCPSICLPFAEEVNGHDLAQIETVKRNLNAVLIKAIEQDRWDGCRFWGDTAAFVCTWMPVTRRRSVAKCLWGLWHSGLDCYRKDTGVSGVFSWMGCFQTMTPPPVRQTIGIRGLNDESNTGWQIAW